MMRCAKCGVSIFGFHTICDTCDTSEEDAALAFLAKHPKLLKRAELRLEKDGDDYKLIVTIPIEAGHAGKVTW